MKAQEIQNQLNTLAVLLHKKEFRSVANLCRSLGMALLKRIYSEIRGQVPPVVMRGFLDREVEIGGEVSDVNSFDDNQMMRLLGCDDFLNVLPDYLPELGNLFAATHLPALWKWMAAASDDEAVLPSALNFFHAWLALAAESIGISSSGSESGPQPGSVKQPDLAPCAPTALNIPVHGKPFTEPTTGMAFVFVPGGEFSMGDIFDEGAQDEKPVHRVTLNDFYMAACPVTQAQWMRLMPENPSRFTGDAHPVEQVSMKDVTAFIEKLNLTAPAGIRFDLPSEAQWEYAARSGGREERYAGGQTPEPVAWCDEDDTGGHTAPVAAKAENGLGLFDMSGNVWEWCKDVYQSDAYAHHRTVDPVCQNGGPDHVIRGGAWHLDAWSVRCARRFRFDPDFFGPSLGFRLVMTPLPLE
ncbi:formylglycine-generating enzyme family protein [Desulfosarcina sp. OttesenSCG-928-A07]|nr:formylglycine-generating enzyme family protein [Desulfosarcina sp. OttesenSCG-928-A07]